MYGAIYKIINKVNGKIYVGKNESERHRYREIARAKKKDNKEKDRK